MKNPVLVIALGIAMTLSLSGCIAERGLGQSYSATGTPELTATLRSLNYSAPASSITSSNGLASTSSSPLSLEWQAAQDLDANYEVSICNQAGTSCTTEFTVLCAGKHICEVQLADGTLVSNYFLNRVSAVNSSTSLTTALAPGFQGFHLELCSIGSSVLTNATMQIHAKKADGTSGDLIQGTAASINLQGRCSLAAI